VAYAIAPATTQQPTTIATIVPMGEAAAGAAPGAAAPRLPLPEEAEAVGEVEATGDAEGGV